MHHMLLKPIHWPRAEGPALDHSRNHEKAMEIRRAARALEEDTDRKDRKRRRMGKRKNVSFHNRP